MKALRTSPSELRLDFTLITGQSFRWRRHGDSYVGVVRDRVFQLKETDHDVHYRHSAPLLPATKNFRRLNAVTSTADEDVALLRDYFNLDLLNLADWTPMWEKDERFSQIAPYIQGARVLRQDPLECLFQFISSSNNHINRITKMVERLCRSYGTHLPLMSASQTAKDSDAWPEDDFYAFPTLMCETDCVEWLSENGGEAWLLSLRECSYEEAMEKLRMLPGVGPKVASCVCLFSLDKHSAIPVDTHVHQLALKHYCPELKGKSLTKSTMQSIENRFIDVFGDYAGWAHSSLFVAELSSHQHYLPSALRKAQHKRKRET